MSIIDYARILQNYNSIQSISSTVFYFIFTCGEFFICGESFFQLHSSTTLYFIFIFIKIIFLLFYLNFFSLSSFLASLLNPPATSQPHPRLNHTQPKSATPQPHKPRSATRDKGRAWRREGKNMEEREKNRANERERKKKKGLNSRSKTIN